MSSDVSHEEEDQRIRRSMDQLIDALDGVLDIDAGLADATRQRLPRDIAELLDDALNIDAGLGQILPAKQAPPKASPKRLRSSLDRYSMRLRGQHAAGRLCLRVNPSLWISLKGLSHSTGVNRYAPQLLALINERAYFKAVSAAGTAEHEYTKKVRNGLGPDAQALIAIERKLETYAPPPSDPPSSVAKGASRKRKYRLLLDLEPDIGDNDWNELLDDAWNLVQICTRGQMKYLSAIINNNETPRALKRAANTDEKGTPRAY